VHGALRRFLVFGVVATALALTAACRDPDTISHERPTVYSSDRVIFPETQPPVLAMPGGGTRPIASILNVPASMRYGEFLWNDAGVPEGKVWVLVDLKAQTMSVFRGQHEIGTAVTLYGVDEKPTPTGRFTVLEKRKDHWSSLYDAPMPYTLRLTYDGIAIHGSDVRRGAGTHGCLGVPLEFGSRLFEQMKVGDEVLVLADGALLRAKAEAA
jgi:hypothetical protein